MHSHRLLLPSLLKSQAYLVTRPRLLGQMARLEPNDPAWRRIWLQDRAAMFWLCQHARLQCGPWEGWLVMAGRSNDTPRIFTAEKAGIGREISSAGRLSRQLSFAQACLLEHGALWLAWPLEAKGVNAAFGEGAWGAVVLARMEEQAAAQGRMLDARLPRVLPATDRERM